VEKRGRARQATDDNIIRSMHFACWVTKAADTHSEYVIFTALTQQQWLRNAPQCYAYMYIAFLVIKTLFTDYLQHLNQTKVIFFTW
jgi:hypothetical protein